jgi:hypothetical protein
LLETTTNHSLLDVKVKRWEELRHLILGEKHPPAIPDFNNEKPSTIPPITDLYKEDFSRTINYFQDIVSQFDETQSDMQLAWSMAPNMPALLRTLAASAEKYKAEQTGMIGAIMDSQKKNRKTQHIRGFCYILIHDYNIHISPHLRKAIAVVSNVVLNDPDDSATAEDVRKALNKLIKYLRNIRRI